MATNKKKILITESFSQKGRTLLSERDDIDMVEFPNMISAGDFEAMLTQHAPVHGVALGATRFGEPELAAAADMKVVTRIGVGYDAVDVPALSRRKVPLMVAGTANSPSVAEQAVFMMLTLAKRAAEMHAIVKDGTWGYRLGKLPYDLYGKTLLIIGFGRIGTRTAKRCLAMEMQVLVYDPYKPAAEIAAAGCEAVADLDAALSRADFVSIHCPKTPETVGLFNAARLKLMKPTAYLINTARGRIVDEPELIRALQEKRIAGAGLDVYWNEPPVTQDPSVPDELCQLDNVILAPHNGGATWDVRGRKAASVAQGMVAMMRGERPLALLNPEIYASG